MNCCSCCADDDQSYQPLPMSPTSSFTPRQTLISTPPSGAHSRIYLTDEGVEVETTPAGTPSSPLLTRSDCNMLTSPCFPPPPRLFPVSLAAVHSRKQSERTYLPSPSPLAPPLNSPHMQPPRPPAYSPFSRYFPSPSPPASPSSSTPSSPPPPPPRRSPLLPLSSSRRSRSM